MSRSKRGHAIAELPLVLLVLALLNLFPLLNLLSVAIGAITAALLVHQSASAACVQQNFSDALTAMQRESTNFSGSGFAKLNKMIPVNGYRDSGMDLSITATDFRTDQVTNFPANTPLSSPPDVLNNVYEYSCKGTFEMGPFISLAGVPFIGQVPGLGRPFIFCYTAHRALEHPKGLDSGGNTLVAFSPQPSGIAGNITGAELPGGGNAGTTDPTAGGWNYPNIFQLIAQAGEKVDSVNVVQVFAINSNWTDAGITVQPNQQLWIDLRSTGAWSNDASQGMTSAAGYPGQVTAAGGPLPGGPDASLVGRVGTNAAFEVGASLQNYALNQTGKLSLIDNDTYYPNNVGVQTVRVILTSKI